MAKDRMAALDAHWSAANHLAVGVPSHVTPKLRARSTRAARLGVHAAAVRPRMSDVRTRHRAWIREHGTDLPEVAEWTWSGRPPREHPRMTRAKGRRHELRKVRAMSFERYEA
jgi:hypothetical protein